MSRSIQRSKAPYLQVVDDLYDRIGRGDLKPGDPIPSERELADEWAISRATATKALAVLRAEHLVESKPGVGTTVRARGSDNKVSGPARLSISVQERLAHMRTTGQIRHEDEQSTIVLSELRQPTSAARAALRLDGDDQAICRVRVSSRCMTPIEICTSWFSAALATSCPRLLTLARVPEGTTAYVERQLSVVAVAVRESVSPTMPDPEDAARLKLAPSTPILVTEVTISTDEGPLVYELYRHAGQRARSYQLPPPRPQ